MTTDEAKELYLKSNCSYFIMCTYHYSSYMEYRQLGLPKDHHYDALCVGAVPEEGYHDLTNGHVLYAKAIGRGSRFRGKTNKCGVIIKKLPPRESVCSGSRTGISSWQTYRRVNIRAAISGV